MRIASAIIVLLLSRTVAAQPSEEPTALPPTRAALELQELDRTHVVLDDSMLRKIRRLQGRRHGLLIGSLVPLTIGIGLTIRGARSGTDDGEIETLLGSIGIAAGILMLGRAPRVGRHANSLANPPSPATRQLQYERRGRRLAGIGGAFLAIGVVTLIGALISIAAYDCEDDLVCIPAGVVLAVPAAAFTAAGLVMVLRGGTHRKRGRAVQGLEVGLGLGNVRLRLQF